MNFRLAICLSLLGCASAFGQIYYSSTVAGIGNAPGWSGDGGPALQAQFNNPTRVALDKAGNVYLVDAFNYSVRKVDTTGIVSTVRRQWLLRFLRRRHSRSGLATFQH